MSVITGRTIDESFLNILKDMDGYVGIASELVRCDANYKKVVANILGNVIIADDIDSANKISIRINKNIR